MTDTGGKIIRQPIIYIMEKDRTKKNLKIWNIALTGFLIVAIVATLERFENGSDFFPVWLIVLCWIAVIVILRQFKIVHESEFPPPRRISRLELKIIMENRKKSEEEKEKQWRRNWELEEEAEDLIARLFAEKEIPLIQTERDRGGHQDGGDAYSFSEPMSLTPDDLYKLKSNRVISVDIKGRGGVLYLHGYSSSGGRLLYTLHKPAAGKPGDASPPPVETAPANQDEEEKDREGLPPENKADAFIRRLCAAKDIGLIFGRSAGSGHDPSPETWIFDKPIPLTASELYALTLTEDIETVDTKMGEDKILYAHAIWRADWVIYRFEQR